MIKMLDGTQEYPQTIMLGSGLGLKALLASLEEKGDADKKTTEN